MKKIKNCRIALKKIIMDFIDLKLLISFCKLVETKSFSKAASELFITQPALSMHINKLEKFLGVELVHRSTKDIELSYAGKIFYKKARKIIKEFNNAKATIDEIKGIKRGVIDIGASTLPGEYILPQIIRDFNDKYPAITINLHIKDTFTIIDEVNHGTYDFGIVGSKENISTLEFTKILDDDIVFVGVNEPEVPSEITLDEIKHFNIIGRERGSGTFHSVLKRVELPENLIKIRAGSLEAIKNLIKAGAGYSFVSIFSIKEEIKNNIFKIIQIKNITPIKRDFYFVKRKNINLSPSSEKFFQIMLKFLKN